MNNKKNFSVVSDKMNREKEQTGVKNTNKITDIDSMLKDHLKASISMEKLEVSEDLVQRTLQKIKQSEGETTSELNNRTVEIIRRNRKVRRFVSAAAAIVLVVASVTVWQSGMIDIGNKGTRTKSLEQAIPNAEMGALDTAPATENAESDSLDYGIMSAPDTSEEYTVESPEDGTVAKDSIITKNSEDENAGNLFSINHPIISYNDVTSFVVTKAGDQSISVTEKTVKTHELYGLLDQFTMNTTTESLEGDWTYIAEITLKDNQVITIYIWESGNIAVSDSAISESSNFYTVDQAATLFEKYSEFYSSLY